MDETDFAKAAFQPSHRAPLLAALQADPALLARARAKVEHLAKQHERGQMFDRDHISRTTHEMLTRMLTQVDALKQEDPGITVT